MNEIKTKINKGGGIIFDMESNKGHHAVLVYGYSSENRIRIYDPQIGETIKKYTDYRDGKGLVGYRYSQSVYF